MPVDLEYLKKQGATEENLRKKFDVKTIDPSGKQAELVKLSAARIYDGLSQNFRDARYWWAIDHAYDVSQRQTTSSLAQGYLNRQPSSNRDVLQAASDWGLKDLLTPVVKCGAQQCDSRGNPVMKLDLPTFFQVFIPVVQAYHKIRVAKLFVDRDTYPLYPYDPIRLTMKDRLKADIITARIQRMATDMGYRAYERQSIHQCVLYGSCLNFPMEDWYKEEQYWHGKKTTVKEGVRYATPHPSRTFCDLAHPPSTINTDTGVQWNGYWDITRWGELRNTKEFWNRDNVGATYGKYGWLKSDGWRLYQELFPCRFPFPDISSRQGHGEQDRLERADSYYQTNDDDRAVTLVSLFQKLIPKEWDLYDYDEPVWHRMVFAAEDTLIWCSPLAYVPTVAYLYDHDQGRAFNTSLGLELMPWQDLMGNYLTQLLLSVKQNLMNVVFWNQDLLDDKYVTLIENLGEKLYRATNFIPFSKRAWSWQQQSERDVFHRVDFPRHDTAGILVAIRTMLDVMERMLGYVPEEVGARGGAEESATKTSIRDRNRSVRLAYTGSFIDEARHARKKQLYDAMMAYSDDEIFAEVADLNDTKRSALKEMGFEVEEESDKKQTKAGVRGSKKSLILDGFATDRDATNRIPDAQIASMMIQTFQSIFSNPQIVEQAGIGQLIDLFNQMLYYAGLPKDFRLRISETDAPQQQAAAAQEQLAALAQQMQEQMAQISQQTVQQELMQFGEAIKGQLTPMMEQQRQVVEALGALAQRMEQSEMRDGIQDEAISRVLKTFDNAALPAPDMMNPA